MANIGRAFKRAAKAAVGSMGSAQYKAADKTILCPHCGSDVFAKGKAQLNTAGMSFLDLDWANKSATTLACTKCGRVEWFIKRPDCI
jgi:predicted nucleic-acid-binding Zn-ribbon protein